MSCRQKFPIHLFPNKVFSFYARTPIIAGIHGSGKTITNPNSIIVGPQLQRVNIKLGHDHIVIRVGFHPSGVHRLIVLPMHEIIDEACDTADFFHQQIQQVNEQLLNTEAYEEMITVVKFFYLKKLSRQKLHYHLIKRWLF